MSDPETHQLIQMWISPNHGFIALRLFLQAFSASWQPSTEWYNYSHHTNLNEIRITDYCLTLLQINLPGYSIFNSHFGDRTRSFSIYNSEAALGHIRWASSFYILSAQSCLQEFLLKIILTGPKHPNWTFPDGFLTQAEHRLPWHKFFVFFLR
jgi:hypothetical protein